MNTKRMARTGLTEHQWVLERERVALQSFPLIAAAADDENSPLHQLALLRLDKIVRVAGAASVISFACRYYYCQDAEDLVKEYWTLKHGKKLSRSMWKHAAILGAKLWELEKYPRL